nr:LacI family DNA-binding transcriptional regulator [Anaerolineae bacterium]
MTAALTLEQIGELAGVSRSTVSRVVNEQPGVKAEVRERVLKVIAETGYQPNPAARSLAGQRTRIIGLVIPETAQILFTDPYFPRLIQGIAQACNASDYALSLFLFHTTDDEVALSKRIAQKQLFDGLLITATYIGDPLVEYLLSSDIRFVQLGYNDNPQVNCVDADNFSGAYQAVVHLIRLGFRRIATITGPMSNLAAVHRKDGYLQALGDRGILVEDDLVATSDYTQEGGYQAMTDLLQHKPEAVFVASDAMSLGALRAMRDHGVSVPDDIALVSYDDLPLALLAEPALTTVRQPIKRLGILGVETLIDILRNGAKPPRRIILPTELVVRDSCGAGRRS